MTVESWASLIVAILTIVSSVALSIRWMVKHYLNELKPNSGSSLKDAINRLEKDMIDANDHRYNMDKKLDNMYDTLLEFISKNYK
jgi:hypothetical protein